MNKTGLVFFKVLIFLALWQAAVMITRVPGYILPSPVAVFSTLVVNIRLILENAFLTFG